MNKKKFIIASGGTGGHFYPGLAVGRALKEQGHEVLFFVRKQDISIDVLKKYDLPYIEMDVVGLPRSFNPLQHLRFMRKLVSSLRATRKLLQKFHPDTVFGTGGYITFPLIFCAHLQHIPTALHDSNSRLGLVNRICGRFTSLFLLGLPIDRPFKNAVLVGTPLRQEFAQSVNRQETLSRLGLNPQQQVVLVMGGSQGAKGLNEAVITLTRKMPQLQFIHLTGTRWFETLKEKYKDCPNVRPLAYCHEMHALMKSADLTICRSGAGTIAELIACQLPAICVPFPHATADHQYYNAKVLADAGAAEIIREGETLSSQLQHAVEAKTPQVLQQMHAAYKKVPVPNPLDTAAQIATLLQNL